MDLYEQLTANLSPGALFEPDTAVEPPHVPVKVIAYHLPQFHAVAENDEWWGKGFTEWTNVTKAVPRFVGHYQPHLPSDLGFYDLTQKEVLLRQADLARRYGIHGFCFHYYWFSGRRILEKPLDIFLQCPEIDIPFCVNWANQNWTRRWDGRERELLLEQRYSEEDDVALAVALARMAKDRRYITVEGRPLIMIYRPRELPDVRKTVLRWRKTFAAEGVADPYIVMPQSDGDEDPRSHDFDAAAGFPPHACLDDLGSDTAGGAGVRLPKSMLFDKSFAGKIWRYKDVAAGALANASDDFRLFPGVMPGWDNDARRPGKGLTIVGSTPALYGQWLSDACRQALQAPMADERIVFVNAWNEWGEGAHLEPDRHFGFAYLAETRRVLTGLDAPSRQSHLSPRKRAITAKKAKFGLKLGLRAKVAGTLEALADAIR